MLLGDKKAWTDSLATAQPHGGLGSCAFRTLTIPEPLSQTNEAPVPSSDILVYQRLFVEAKEPRKSAPCQRLGGRAWRAEVLGRMLQSALSGLRQCVAICAGVW